MSNRHLVRVRAFRWYLGASLLSNVGAEMLAVAVGWQVYALRHRALDLGYVGLVQLVAAVGLSLPAGALADRVDRARLVAVCNVALAACAVALLALAASGCARVAPLYALVFAAAAARAFEGPAAHALVPDLVPAEQLAPAVAWSSTAWQVATIAGPALGGALYGLAGSAAWAYGGCAAALVGAAACAFAIRAPASAPSAPTAATTSVADASTRAALRFVRRDRVILEVVTLDLFAVLLGGATALLPVFAHDVLAVGPSGLGALRSAPAIGATLAAIALAHRPLARRAGPTLLACVAVFGAATIGFGFSRSFGASLALLAVLGAADMVSVVVRATVVQLRTPPAMRGRVSAINAICIAASADLGALESGATAAWLGAVPAVIIGGAGTLAVVAIYALVLRGLRGVDTLQ